RKHREWQQAFLLQLNDALRPLSDPSEIQRAAMRVVGEYLALDRAMYAEITPDGETVIVNDNYLSGRFPPFTGEFPLAAYGSIINKLRDGEPMIVADVDAETELTEAERTNYKEIGATAVVTIPLIKGGRWVSNFVVHQGEPRRWTKEEIAVLQETAERTWAAVTRARAEEALRESEERQAFLLNLSDVLRPLADALEIQQAAMRVVGEHLKVDRVLYADVSDDGETLHIADNYVRGDFPKLTGDTPVSVFGKTLEIVRRGEAFVIEDVSLTDQMPEAEKAEARARNIYSTVAVPLVKAGRWVSNLVIHHGSPRKWTADEIALLQVTAERTWAAVERARAEVALRASEEKYRTLFETIDEGFCIVEVVRRDDGAIDYRFLDLNPAYERIIGITRSELVGRTVREAIPGLEDVWYETMERVGFGGESIHLEEYLAPVGKWLETNFSPVGDGKISVIFSDITERKLAEEALRQSEETFSALVENAPFGVYLVDAEFRLRTINAGSRKVFGGIHPLVGRDFAEILRILWQEPFATEAIERFRHTLKTGESFVSPPITEKRANIEEIESYDWQIHRVLLPDGSYGVVCYFYDLSEQKRLEETVRRAADAVRASEERLRLTTESVTDYAIFTKDTEGRITSWNFGA
ncbi:MAG: GAF domain-containing protein, partial [Acidobacteria bacterium]|nr:GAF domain-containing protein [Acidobacteriota bacterium]